jgi:hypothetical protein
MVESDPDLTALATSLEGDDGGYLALLGAWVSGIPKIFQKPLAKAAGRLLFGMVEVPATALAAKASDIKHSQAIKQKMRAALAKEAIAQLPTSPDIVERALNHFAANILGKQQNREAVLQQAAEELAQSPEQPAAEAQQQSTPEPDLDDDWLNDFARRAENASTERVRNLFSRVLAGEIRRPGSYSLFTLDFLSKLSPGEAALIVSIAPYALGNMVPLTEKSQAVLDFSLSTSLGGLGILSATSIGSMSAMTNYSTDHFGIIIPGRFVAFHKASKYMFFIATEEKKSVSINCSILTKVGEEVLTLHACDPDPIMLAQVASHLASQGAELHIAKSKPFAAGLVWQQPLQRIFPSTP